MILQALTRYYDILSNDPESDIAPPGYSAIGISYVLNISAKGELLDVLPLFEQVQRGKKLEEKPRRMIVPEQVKRTGPIPNFLWDNSAFVLGFSDKDTDDPEYSIKRFEAFSQFHKDLLSKTNSDSVKALIAYLAAHNPLTARENPKILPHIENLLKGRNLVFMFNGGFVHEDVNIRRAWESHKASSDAVMGQCLITGEIAPIARLHPSLKGVGVHPNPMGASLVSFNDRSYESFNKTKLQGLNSPISEKAAFSYTTVLNYLLSSTENKKFNIGDTTVVYWAESEQKAYAKAFLGLCEPEEVEIKPEETAPTRDKKAEKRAKKIAEKVRRVQALDVDKLLKDLDGNPRFYVLGLAPNAARVSVRFFHSDPFNKVVEKIMQHYKDLEIVKEFEDQHTYLTIQDILKETVSPKANDKDALPLLAGSVFRAILENTPYPAALFNSIINRVRADQDEKFTKKINYARAAIVKAYLLRKYRNQPKNKIQEVLIMSLNEQSTHPAYVLGRLFAWLEKLQQDAIGDVNAGIKDRYFTSACASPASVFPILLRLSQHHISKVKQGDKRTFNYDRRIGDILNLLDIANNPIPSHLSLDDQGAFILGYYHQRKDIFTPKNNGNTAAASESETK